MASDYDGTGICVTPPIKRGKFYHDTITLEVEGTVHRVCRYGFETWSLFFRDLFTLPQGDGQSEGKTDENPIRLVGCTNFELESLLEIMYPSLGLVGTPTLSKEQWIGALRLARLWDMSEIASLAIDKLSAFTLTPIEKITLGKDHGVPTWLKEGYTDLIADLTQVSLDQISSLGWETTSRILWAHKEVTGVRDPGGIWVPTGQMFCAKCDRSYGRRTVIGVNNLSTSCSYCGTWNGKPAIDASTLIANSASGTGNTNGRNQTITDKVSEVFEEELKDAERRNTPSSMPT